MINFTINIVHTQTLSFIYHFDNEVRSALPCLFQVVWSEAQDVYYIDGTDTSFSVILAMEGLFCQSEYLVIRTEIIENMAFSF